MPGPSSVRFEVIGPDNEAAVAALSVSPDQEAFVASNASSIEESRSLSWVRSLAIIAGDELVGFLAYGRDPADGECWLYRFMIDQRFQRRGLGRAALRQLVDRLISYGSCQSLTIGYQPDNLVAERLYRSEGFAPAGTADWGETLVRREFARGPADAAEQS